MTEPQTTPNTSHTSTDGVWRWLVGGLAAGAVLLGLLIAAYAIGYDRGRDHGRTAAPAPPTSSAETTTTTTTAPTTAPSPTTQGPVPVTPALVARGKALFTTDGCAACHSLSGSSGVGPTLKGAAGRTVTLETGETVTADDAYLERSIADPDAQVVEGYRAGVMSAAVAAHDLSAKPDDIRALVAFVKSQR